MDKLFEFIKKNVVAFSIAIPVLLIYLYFNYKGNRICDCKSTEKYSTANASGSKYNGVHHFYHK